MKEKIYNRTAVYTGRRLHGGKVYQRFELLPEHKEIFFRGIRGVHLGYHYACTEKAMPPRPTRTADSARVENAEWEAADELVDAHNAEKRANAVLEQNSRPAIKAAITALRPLMVGLTYFQRRALLEHLAEKARGPK